MNTSNILSPPSHQHPLRTPIMNNHHGQGSQPPTPSTTGPPDTYARAPSSGYYQGPPPPPPSTQSFFPSFTTTHNSPPPPLTSPTAGGGLSRGISALSLHQQQSPIQAPHYPHSPYGYRPLPPALGGAVLTNMQNPGGQVALLGGINPMPSPYHPPGQLLGPMYHHQGAPNSHQDRPYKCDLCPTSFNRNHDLKRHKRIHLSIKPFPCTYCDKSFSRKDALKRHRLVKGCGTENNEQKSGNRNSPQANLKHDPGGPSSTLNGIKAEPV